jgi:hypothetical protein
MSALASKGGVKETEYNFRNVPEPEVETSSLDHLVGQREQRRRHFDIDRACGLQIDREREPRRFLKRQNGNFCALENAVNILRCPAVA